MHTLNVIVHIAAGALALAVGLAPLFSRKGEAAHRLYGRLTAGLGLVVLGSALAGVILFDPPGALVAVTITAGYQYVSGLRALTLAQRGPGLLDAAGSLGAACVAVIVAVEMGQGGRSWTPMIGYSTLGYLAMMIAYDLSRPFWRQAWLRIRPLDHGLKMTGFYFAMASAGAGNLLRDWQPWSQLAPSMAGLVLMTAFAVWYAFHPVGRVVGAKAASNEA